MKLHTLFEDTTRCKSCGRTGEEGTYCQTCAYYIPKAKKQSIEPEPPEDGLEIMEPRGWKLWLYGSKAVGGKAKSLPVEVDDADDALHLFIAQDEDVQMQYAVFPKRDVDIELDNAIAFLIIRKNSEQCFTYMHGAETPEDYPVQAIQYRGDAFNDAVATMLAVNKTASPRAFRSYRDDALEQLKQLFEIAISGEEE